MIRAERLDCGLRLVTEDMNDARSVSIGFWVGTGSRDETDSLAGASHFLEHLLFKGSATRSAESIARSMDAVGGDMNAFTTKEYTAFYVRLLSEDTDLGLDVLSDVIWSPALRCEDLEAEREVILDEIRMHADEPADLVHEAFHAALFPSHPLGREVLGLVRSVEGMDTEAIRRFFELHYRPANVVVSVAGDVDHAEVADGLSRRFDGSPGGKPPKRSAPGPSSEPLVLTSRPTEQAHLVVGVRSLDRHRRERWALECLNHVLGGGMSSRLFQEVRERRGLAYSVFSDRVAYQDSGLISVYVGTAPGHLHEVAELVSEELDRLATQGVTDAELAVAKGHLRAEALLSLEDSAARMGRIGRSLLLHDEALSAEELVARVDAVTVDDVGGVAAEVLGRTRTTSVVGPIEPGEFFPG